MAQNGESQTCRRCNAPDVCIVCRSQPLCKDCFLNYVQTKVVKRMEALKARNFSSGTPPRYLLALSLGISSTSLLHVLTQQLDRQLVRSGRPGFSLQVLFVDNVADNARSENLAIFDEIKKHFPMHTYHVAQVLDQVIQDQDSIADTSLLSMTSRMDLQNILLQRTIIHQAKLNDCHAILFGDCTTRLAGRILAETSKGRGFALPWLMAEDGSSAFGISMSYPMRDLLTKELVQYAAMVDPPMTSLVKEPTVHKRAAVSSKTTTIDDLMGEYFQSVEESYPSIVANVVRTSGKLQPPPSELTTPCRICGIPVERGTFGLTNWGGAQRTSEEGVGNDDRDSVGSELCYGCTRSTQSTAA